MKKNTKKAKNSQWGTWSIISKNSLFSGQEEDEEGDEKGKKGKGKYSPLKEDEGQKITIDVSIVQGNTRYVFVLDLLKTQMGRDHRLLLVCYYLVHLNQPGGEEEGEIINLPSQQVYTFVRQSDL
eukprot:TRINITY_DN12272_c0_g1_i1.p1 TRINITY_DN12272_c0_g1~~TRINITY_DN12272_c0_g1_i1.p1  ORF type:complete len:125 (-),score=45.68 TRINITY_DN12272_c0_g1_i1:201-575(-)